MRTAFNPNDNGFRFVNSFVNHVVKVPALGIDITTNGRCGGMAAAALDCWHNRLAIPDEASLPADGSLLGDYIYSRLIHTMLDNAWSYLHFMRTPDHPTWINGIGVARATREEQFPRIRTMLDAGTPCLVGLSQARSVDQLGYDHQVVAYGYESDERYTYLLVYDNNHPGSETRLRFTTGYDPGEREVVSSDRSVWRGFFAEAYSPVVPWFLADGKLLSERSSDAIHVVRGGARFHVPSPEEFEANGFAWSEVVEVQDGSLAHVAVQPADATLIRERSAATVHVVYGGRRFSIPSPDVLTALGFTFADVRVVPDGSLGRLLAVPRDGTLLRELSAAPVYVVQGGVLRHIPDAAAFDEGGYVWGRVRVVPDGALAELPMGQPLASTHADPAPVARSWAERPSGSVYTSANDRIDYTITPNARPADEVQFVLELGSGITWRKELVLHADDGEWTIAAQDGTRQGSNGLYRYQLPSGALRFRKAQMFGIVGDVHGLGHLDQLPEGAEVRFTWTRD